MIHRALQLSLGRLVAIKLMSAGEFARPEVVQRFRTEAMAAAKLQHPNIVAIHEVGEHAGLQYVSMDLVERPNLPAQLAGQPLPALRTAQLLKILADAVQYAHDRGILHRDLKPSNVLIAPFGAPRITDFGLAKDIAADSNLRVTRQVLGTPGDLPPEQADPSRGPLGPTGDLYSLGAILYFTLTGRPPFVGGTVHKTIRQVLNDDPVAPRLLNSGVPRDLETICLKCLEREPTRRHPTASELAAGSQALSRWTADPRAPDFTAGSVYALVPETPGPGGSVGARGNACGWAQRWPPQRTPLATAFARPDSPRLGRSATPPNRDAVRALWRRRKKPHESVLVPICATKRFLACC